MRIDKYLKVSRLIKRRTVAKEMVEKNRVFLNGKSAKPSSEVTEGDILEIKLPKHYVKVKITALLLSSSKESAKEMFLMLEEKHEEA